MGARQGSPEGGHGLRCVVGLLCLKTAMLGRKRGSRAPSFHGLPPSPRRSQPTVVRVHVKCAAGHPGRRRAERREAARRGVKERGVAGHEGGDDRLVVVRRVGPGARGGRGEIAKAVGQGGPVRRAQQGAARGRRGAQTAACRTAPRAAPTRARPRPRPSPVLVGAAFQLGARQLRQLRVAPKHWQVFTGRHGGEVGAPWGGQGGGRGGGGGLRGLGGRGSVAGQRGRLPQAPAAGACQRNLEPFGPVPWPAR
jgi:hypothetical protein